MNIEVGPADSLTTYRKIAIASWRHPRDPTTYSWIDLPVETAEKFLQSFEAETPTLTHFVALIMGDCVNCQPEFNRFQLTKLKRAWNLTAGVCPIQAS